MDLIDYACEPIVWGLNKYVDVFAKTCGFLADKLDDVSFRFSETAHELRWVANAIGATP